MKYNASCQPSIKKNKSNLIPCTVQYYHITQVRRIINKREKDESNMLGVFLDFLAILSPLATIIQDTHIAHSFETKSGISYLSPWFIFFMFIGRTPRVSLPLFLFMCKQLLTLQSSWKISIQTIYLCAYIFLGQLNW